MPFDAPAVTLSPEQVAIAQYVADGKGNLVVRARAGTGKSFTIRKVAPLFSGKVAIVAFGKDAASEMAAKCAEEGIKADVGTFHSFGFRVLRGAYSKAKVVSASKKFDAIAEKLSIPQHLQSFSRKAMGLAMQRGFGIFFPLNDKQQWLDLVEHFDLESELGEDNIGLALKGREATVQDGLRFACRAIKVGLQMVHEVISFDDMMYAPLVLNLPFPKFNAVLGDEMQDSNACRREICARLMAPGARLMAVGDDCQAIMGFTGADNDALEQIIDRFQARVFPLTETRRCSQAVARLGASIVDDYRAHPSNPEGSVTVITASEFNLLALVPGQDAVICRKTAPMVALCYKLLARGIPAKVFGRDLDKTLLDIIDRWKVKSLTVFKDKLEDYREKMVAKYLQAKQESTAEAIEDKCEAILAMIAALPANTATVADLRAQVVELFADAPDGSARPVVALMTAHKSKGLEFKRVFGYGNDKWFPSKFAKQEWQLKQEDFLLYVLWTRAMLDYVDVVVEE